MEVARRDLRDDGVAEMEGLTEVRSVRDAEMTTVPMPVRTQGQPM